MSEVINRHEVRVVGMSRSGNHAILNWIYLQAEGSRCFLNCVEPKTNPFTSARPMDDGQSVWTSNEDLDLAEEAAGRLSPKDWLIYSYEDCFLGMVTHADFENHREAYLGRSAQRTDVLILRDPFNLFASRLRAQYDRVTPATAVRIWKQHANEYLGRRRYLPRHRVAISFNRWADDADYRRELAQQLQLRFTDAGFEEVTPTGGGSSFDGRKFSGRASRMKVLERWKKCADDEQYLSTLDPEMLSLSRSIFGEIPGTEAIVDRVINGSTNESSAIEPA